MKQPFIILKKGDAANYANYQQGVTFLSIRASVHCSIALVDFGDRLHTMK